MKNKKNPELADNPTTTYKDVAEQKWADEHQQVQLSSWGANAN